MDDRIAAAKKVREQFPADYFAHRFYQEQFWVRGQTGSGIEHPPQLDRGCRWRAQDERIGFGNGEDMWVDEVIGVMEKARPK